MTEWQYGECERCGEGGTKVTPCCKCEKLVCSRCSRTIFFHGYEDGICHDCYHTLYWQKEVEQHLENARVEIDAALELLQKYGGLRDD